MGRSFSATVLVLIAVLVLFSLPLLHTAATKSELVEVEMKPITRHYHYEIILGPYTLRLWDSMFFEALPETAFPVSVHVLTRFPEQDEPWICVIPQRFLLEYDAEPTQRPTRTHICGTISPGYYDDYGPFQACITIQVEVTWTPENQDILVGCVEAETGEGPGYIGSGGYFRVYFSTDIFKNYYIIIGNPPWNTQTITYDGCITLWRPW
jgi:hypothetical protein